MKMTTEWLLLQSQQHKSCAIVSILHTILITGEVFTLNALLNITVFGPNIIFSKINLPAEQMRHTKTVDKFVILIFLSQNVNPHTNSQC